MAHYSRLAQRTSETPKEWLRTCAQIGEVINTWAGRSDLAVYAGEDAVSGEAIAAFYHATAEVEINLGNAFGKATTPAMVGDLRERNCQFEHPQAVGVMYHEALHARYTNWNYAILDAIEDAKVVDAFMLLEESRIEAWGVINIPKNKVFLQASALKLALADFNEEADLTQTWAVAHLAGLALARVDAGVVEARDVAVIRAKVVDFLGEELLAKLREIWVEFQTLTPTTTDPNKGITRAIELATKWVELLREKAEENGEPTGGEGIPQEVAEAMAEALGELAEAMAEAMENSQITAGDAVADQQTSEEMEEEATKRKQEAKKQNQNKATAKEVFDQNSSRGTGEQPSALSRSVLHTTRKPTSEERVASVKVAQMLERAKYRERDVTTVRSVLPQGRLRSRAVVQNKALESKGVRDLTPAWEHKTRKHTDEPTLSVGVMVDISGSMGSAMNPMATTAWVMAEAGRRIQAKTAMVYFGNDVFPTLKVGQKLDEVRVYTAPDGTEKFGKGFSALEGALDLFYGRGARMLVVVSDGCYTEEETANAKATIRECEKNGVAVLWISPEQLRGQWSAKGICEGTQAVLVDGLDGNKIATLIGKACADALERTTSRV